LRTYRADTTFVRVGPTRVRVRTAGSGPPLLMIMGIGGNLHMWEPLAAQLTKRELIMFDFPGTGGSGPSFLPPTMAANALFTNLLLRKLDYGRIDVLGYSWGGVLAQQLAIQHPRSVRRLVLASTTVGLGGVPPGPMVSARMMTPRRYYSRSYFTKIAPALYGGRYRTDPKLVNEEVNRRVGRPPSMWGRPHRRHVQPQAAVEVPAVLHPPGHPGRRPSGDGRQRRDRRPDDRELSGRRLQRRQLSPATTSEVMCRTVSSRRRRPRR
jgi:pimeloyl-ACP methyl ester carboxylesterase